MFHNFSILTDNKRKELLGFSREKLLQEIYNRINRYEGKSIKKIILLFLRDLGEKGLPDIPDLVNTIAILEVLNRCYILTKVQAPIIFIGKSYNSASARFILDKNTSKIPLVNSIGKFLWNMRMALMRGLMGFYDDTLPEHYIYYISNYFALDEIDYTTAHEYAHHLDGVLGIVNKRYKKEVERTLFGGKEFGDMGLIGKFKKQMGIYALTNEYEFFAETFALYTTGVGGELCKTALEIAQRNCPGFNINLDTSYGFIKIPEEITKYISVMRGIKHE